MKVSELITKLQALDQDAEVTVTSANFELNGAYVSATLIRQYNEGKKFSETFRDAFDGETYDKEVWSMTGGDCRVVMIS